MRKIIFKNNIIDAEKVDHVMACCEPNDEGRYDLIFFMKNDEGTVSIVLTGCAVADEKLAPKLAGLLSAFCKDTFEITDDLINGKFYPGGYIK